MEYLKLGTLQRVIHDPSQSYGMELMNTWIRQIATGLACLHENGIIHRDVKPDNILLAARDHLKLADFGLARNISGTQGYTSGMMGTDPYMAPEVIGMEKNYGPPADIYSLGVTIWEIITRQHPRWFLEMKEISNCRLSELIKKCLQKNASDRASINKIIKNIPEPQTILVIDIRIMAVLNADRSEWTQLELKLPDCGFKPGVVWAEEIYVVGGIGNAKCLYKLDNKTLKWNRLADMNIERYSALNSCLEWDGYIWVFGGKNKSRIGSNYYISSVERYDPKEDKWTLMPKMIHARWFATVTVWHDRIIVAGGYTDDCEITNSVECFNPADGTWTELPNMPESLSGYSLGSYKNKIIVMCYQSGENIKQASVYELDPLEENPRWKPLPPLKYPVSDFGRIVLDDEIYAIGGTMGGPCSKATDRVEIFDGKQWRLGPNLPFRTSGIVVLIIPQHLADRLCKYKRK